MQVRIYLHILAIRFTRFSDSIFFNTTILITGLGGKWIYELCRSELARGIMVSWGRWELACIFLR